MINILKSTPVSSQCCNNLNSMAYDGCNYYFTIACKKVIQKTNKSSSCAEYINTCHLYDKICYDQISDCFWASQNETMNTVFKLDKCFNEIDCINISNKYLHNTAITGISLDCVSNRLIISTGSCIIYLNKAYPYQTEAFKVSDGEIFYSSYSLSPFIFATVLKNNVFTVKAFNKSGNVVDKLIIPSDCMISSAAFIPYDDKKVLQQHLAVLVLKHGMYAYIYEVEITNTTIKSAIAACNYYIKECNCSDCCDCCCETGCTSVLCSVAKEENAIADILTAESKKINKLLQNESSTCDILKANKSVNEALSKATTLEQAIYLKLSALADCCDFCEVHKAPDPDLSNN